MMPKRIILVRHGFSEANEDSTVYERMPDHLIPLTPVGIEQAVNVGKKIGSMIGTDPFGILASPYRRTIQTKDAMLEGIARAPEFDYQDPSLREQEYGNMPACEESKLNRAYRDKIGKFFYRFPEGESCADVYDRMAIFMQSLFRRFEQESCPTNIIIVSHGTAIKCFLARWYHWSVEYFDSLGLLPNCHVSVLTNNGDREHARYLLSEPYEKERLFGL